jgi:hypothetical protein
VQSVKILILFSMWAVIIAAFSFLILPFRGEVVGLSIAFIYLLTTCLLLDKWVLLFFLAAPLKKSDKFLDIFESFSYTHNVREVNFYYSRLALKNIVAIEWFGRKIIIIGQDCRKSANLEGYIIHSLVAFRNGNVKRNRNLAFIFSLYNLPIILIEKLFGRLRFTHMIISMWVTPFNLLCEANETVKIDMDPIIQNAPAELELSSFSLMLVRILGIYKNESHDLVSIIFRKEYS